MTDKKGKRQTHPDFPGAFGRADWRGDVLWEYGSGQYACRLVGQPGDPEFLEPYQRASLNGSYEPRLSKASKLRGHSATRTDIDPCWHPPRFMTDAWFGIASNWTSPSLNCRIGKRAQKFLQEPAAKTLRAKGGRKRPESMTPERHAETARKAAESRWKGSLALDHVNFFLHK